MRSRNINPNFFSNEELSELQPVQRILFIGLWCLADRAGVFENRVRRIKHDILPWGDNWDTSAVMKSLKTLEEKGFIVAFEADNKGYWWINNFRKHQAPHFKEANRFPLPPISIATSKDMERQIKEVRKEAKERKSKVICDEPSPVQAPGQPEAGSDMNDPYATGQEPGLHGQST